MNDKIKAYLDSVVPKNIPEKRQKDLRMEITSHICDKIDWYEEIGYTKEQSIDKALAEMGEGEEVKKSISERFEEMYHERTWWAVAAFFISFAVQIIFGILNLDLTALLEDNISGYFFLGSVFVFAIIMIIYLLKVKNYRKILVSVGLSFVCSSLFKVVILFDDAFSIMLALNVMLMPAVSLCDNIFYLLDRFTNLSGLMWVTDFNSNLLLCAAGYSVIALYAFVSSHKIKRCGTVKSIKKEH